VESLASGKPVIAWQRGGVLETAARAGDEGAFLYLNPTVESLQNAIERFELAEGRIRPEALQSAALSFSEAEFIRKFRVLLDNPKPSEYSRDASASRKTGTANPGAQARPRVTHPPDHPNVQKRQSGKDNQYRLSFATMT